jgi:hypothetical protein
MKPAWDQLSGDFADSTAVAIIDVDCTSDDSKDLCSKYGVKGYPTIKYFTSSTDPLGDKYEGGRTYDDLKKFADENLGPSCSPAELDLCNDEQKAEIEKFQAIPIEELKATVAERTAAAEAAEKTFKDEVAKLQSKYESLMKEKDEAVAAAAVPSVVRSVIAASKKGGDDADAKDEL